MTERIAYLKEQLDCLSDDAVFYERVILLLEAEKQCRNLDNGAKYTRCFQYMLENMTVDIRKEELIVGLMNEKLLSDEEEANYEKACKRYNFKATELFSFDPLHIIDITDSDSRFAPEWLNSYGHCIPDWEKILRIGFDGIRSEILAKQTEKDLSDDQVLFLDNARIACDCVSAFIGRYAERAEDLAKTAEGEDKNRLQNIADNCRSIQNNGAPNFYAAVQLLWFNMFILHAVCGARDYGYGRLDQYLYPYYENDLARGIFKKDQAEEILHCLFLKTNEIIGYGWEAYQAKRVLCVNSLQYIMISGADLEGKDTTNAISWMILQAIDTLQLKQPTVNIRYHTNIDPDFMDRACRIAAKGFGFPSFFHDATVEKALARAGVSKEEAVNYAYYGCNNSFLPGHEDELREAWHCLPKYLEYALNRGACMLTGMVQGCITPNCTKVHIMDDIYDALRLQMADGIQKMIRHVEQSDKYWSELKPFSYESVLMSSCIQKASSFNDNGSLQKHINCHMVGIATMANSLYALNRLVFKEKRFTPAEFVELLKNDWEDEEYTRTYAAERYPKYGNDIDEVDMIAAKVAVMFIEEIEKVTPTSTGRKLYPSIYSLWHHRAFGQKCSATADGRRAGEDLSESQSPVYGTEEFGPTAMLNSVAKLPLGATPSGGMNVKFQPKLFTGTDGYKKLGALLEGFFEKGGMHAQINVISRETLENAKLHPEKYKNLLVRVVGYSTYFATLSPEQQQELIDRSEL